MIEQGFKNADSTIKEMTDLIETRTENLEPKEEMKKSLAAAKNSPRKPKRGEGKTPAQMVLSPARNQLKLAVQATKYYILAVNEVILWTVANISLLWSTSTSRKKEEFQDLQKEQPRIERY